MSFALDPQDGTNEGYGFDVPYGRARRGRVTTVGRKAFLEGRIRAAEMELQRLSAYGDDIYEDEAVLVFRYRYTGSQKTAYLFAALKVKGKWYLTDQRGRGGIRWDELVALWMEGTVDEMWVVESYLPVEVNE